MKPYQAKKDAVVGNTTVVPVDDNDALFHFYDQQGESMYTNPPDPNMPLIDHGLDEETVWAFRKTGYNQDAIFNEYTRDPWNAMKLNHVPFWGHKLSTPAFYTDAKFDKFHRQWQQRLGLELIKIRQAQEWEQGNEVQAKAHKAEIQNYIAEVQEKQIEHNMKDVYVTDHKKATAKLLTHSEEEDAAFFKYKQALAAYKADKPEPVVPAPRLRFEKGSLQQRLFDPLAGGRKNADGTLVYEVTDKELAAKLDEARLRKQFDNYQNQEAIDGTLEEEDDELRIILMEEIESNDLPIDQWNAMLDKELSVFKNGKRYDYVEDLQEAFQEGLRTPLTTKILRTIPDHAFWDIKKPLNMQEDHLMNEYNPARQVHGSSFFDIRQNYAYFLERELHSNIKPRSCWNLWS